MASAKDQIEWGCARPYDRDDEDDAPYTGRDPARRAVLGILSSMLDRRGIKHALHEIDQDVREEIVETFAEIVRTAYLDRSARPRHGRSGA